MKTAELTTDELVVGAMMGCPDYAMHALLFMSPRDFQDPLMQELYLEVVVLMMGLEPTTAVAVWESGRAQDAVVARGGLDYLKTLEAAGDFAPFWLLAEKMTGEPNICARELVH